MTILIENRKKCSRVDRNSPEIVRMMEEVTKPLITNVFHILKDVKKNINIVRQI